MTPRSRVPFALSAYPLSGDYRHGLEELLGVVPEYLTLPQLRRLPPFRVMTTLRALGRRPCLLPFEDEASMGILPILQAVALVATPSSVEVVGPDFRRESLTYRQLPPAAARLTRATADGVRAGIHARRDLDRLLRTPRARHQVGTHHRILHLNPNLWFGLKVGGSVGHLAGVANGFTSSGYAVDLFTATDAVLVRPEVNVVRLEPPRAFGFPHELNFYAFQQQAVRQVLADARPPYDFVYHRMSVANYAGVVLARRLGVPLVLEYNGSEVWAARHWGKPLRFERVADAAERACLRHAHVVVTVSAVLRDELIERGVAEERIACYPNGVDTEMYDPERFTHSDVERLRARYGIDSRATVATFIGTFGHWHGADLLARAIARLVDENESWIREHRLHFVLVGDGLKMAEVRAAVDTARCRPYVTLTGLVPQKEGPGYLAASDILLSPHVPNPDGTPFFGSPTKLFEYMAMGRGILASGLDQIAEVLTPSLHTNALPDDSPDALAAAVSVIVEPGDEDDLVRGLRFLVERPDWRATLGRNARKRALERHTWRRHVEEVLARLGSLGRDL